MVKKLICGLVIGAMAIGVSLSEHQLKSEIKLLKAENSRLKTENDALIYLSKLYKLEIEKLKLELSIYQNGSPYIGSSQNAVWVYEPINKTIKLKNFKITFYSNDPYSINKPEYRDGLTATHIPANIGVIAVDPTIIPLGSVVYIEKLKRFFVACDKGSAIKGKRIDVYVPSRKEALKLGVMKSDVIICGKVDLEHLKLWFND